MNDCGQTRQTAGTKSCVISGGWGGWWGGVWWGSNFEKDNCLSWSKWSLPDANKEWTDYVSSYYDKSCGQSTSENKTVVDNNIANDVKDSTQHWSATESVKMYTTDDLTEAEKNKYENEMQQAYIYAINHKITTIYPITKADMYWKLIRKHLAKMISEYAIQEVGLKPNTTRVCKFDDIKDQTQEMQKYVVLSVNLV